MAQEQIEYVTVIKLSEIIKNKQVAAILEKLSDKDGVVIASADTNGKVYPETIRIYTNISEDIYGLLDSNGELVISK